MKKNNIKIYSVAISGAVLLNFALYKGYEKLADAKPFHENYYQVNNIEEYEISKCGIEKREYSTYNTVNTKDNNGVIIKTPYEKYKNDNIVRNYYIIPNKYLEDYEIEYIKSNVKNQEDLFSQEWINSYVETIEDNDHSKLYRYETSNYIPENNNYEISYIISSNDLNAHSYVKDKNRDISNSAIFSAISIGSTAAYLAAANKIIKKKDKKYVKEIKK